MCSIIKKTECERILEKGILPESFFMEEVRCDFLVTKKMKKVWAVQIDLLMELDRVCKKYNLNYYMSDGSLLGTIRHKGFIPWDDDIDVNMLREDYNKLLDVCQDEFQYPYFFQTPHTDKESFFSYGNLRNSNTSGIIYPFRYQQYNHGINIDIFPLDNCVLDDLETRYNRIRELVMDNSAYMRKSNPNPTPEDVIRIRNHSGRNPIDVFEEMDKICRQYENEETELVNSATEVSYSPTKLVFRKEWFDNVIYSDFEGIKVPIIKEYDSYLRIHYGEYMELPSVEKRGEWHSKMVYEPDMAYTDFLPSIL